MVASVASIEATTSRLFAIAKHCRLCPWECGVNRVLGEIGRCRGGKLPRVYTYGPHFGEEPPLVGTAGSGTIFFSFCSLHCIYCQNRQFSQRGLGSECSVSQLADFMLDLQRHGCANLNLVTAAHYLPWTTAALAQARSQGCTLPVVYNSSGYERPEIIELLEPIVDVYLADMRYSSDEAAEELSGARSYRSINRAALAAMVRSKGALRTDGPYPAGTIIRILVIPGYLDEARDLLRYIRTTYGPEFPLSLMGQYHPHPDLNGRAFLERFLTAGEYEKMVEFAQSLGFSAGWYQEPLTATQREQFWGLQFQVDVRPLAERRL